MNTYPNDYNADPADMPEAEIREALLGWTSAAESLGEKASAKKLLFEMRGFTKERLLREASLLLEAYKENGIAEYRQLAMDVKAFAGDAPARALFLLVDIGADLWEILKVAKVMPTDELRATVMQLWLEYHEEKAMGLDEMDLRPLSSNALILEAIILARLSSL